MVDKRKGRAGDNDPAWDHCTQVFEEGKNKRLKLRCNHCGISYWGGISRIKHHLARTRKDVAPCTKSSDDVRDIFKRLIDAKKKDDDDEGNNFIDIDDEESKRGSIESYYKGKRDPASTTLNTLWKKEDRDGVCSDIARFLYANALPFNLVKSPYFKAMMIYVGHYGHGLKLPSYHEVRIPLLKKEVDNINKSLEKYKSEWKKTGCTLMSDGWTDGKQRSITNFLVNSPSGTVFVKSVDTSSISKTAENLFELLDAMVDEIGEESVLQVVTDSAAAYVKAGEMLMDKRKKLFWSPCDAHCLDLILSDIGEEVIHKDTVSKAKRLTVYIYRHSWVLNLMRKKTKGRELTRPAVTRFATAYLTLKSVHENRVALRAMFASEEWATSLYAKKIDGKFVQDIVLTIVLTDKKFWKAIKHCLKAVLPLVKVLRLVDGDSKPAMGYIYEAMDRAKEKIQKDFKGVVTRYKPYWDIIDLRWNLQLHRPLHATAYYLNPRFHYETSFEPDIEIKMGLYHTIERLCPDAALRKKIDKQLEQFHRADGMFGLDMAKLTRNDKQPALWWESYGGSCKELQSLAIRILSLTCSATRCERNWSTFDQVHSKRRNRLEQQRMNALVFVKYNLQLDARHMMRQQKDDSYDPICLSDMESDDEWITKMEDPCLPEDTTWLDIQECFQVKEEGSRKKKRGPRPLNKMDKGKKKVVEEEEDEEAYDNESEEEEIGEAESGHGEGMNLDDEDSEMELDFDN